MDALYRQVTSSHVIRETMSSKIRQLKLYHLFSIRITLTSILKLLKYLMCQRLGLFRLQFFCFKNFNNLLPLSLESLFTLNQDLHPSEAQNSCDIVHETPSIKGASFLIRFFAPAICNLIPLEIRNSNSLITFKRTVKGHYRNTVLRFSVFFFSFFSFLSFLRHPPPFFL